MTERQVDKYPVEGLRPPGFGSSPVKKWKGKLVDIGEAEAYGSTPAKPKVNVTFDFEDITVYAADVPWNFPTAHIEIKHSKGGYIEDIGGSSWGYFGNSILTMGLHSIYDLLNRMQTWERDDNVNYGKGMTPSKGYRVVEVEGLAAKQTSMERALEVLDGLTEAEFYQAVTGDSLIRTDTALWDEIFSKKFLTRMLAEGKATPDKNSVWHVK